VQQALVGEHGKYSQDIEVVGQRTTDRGGRGGCESAGEDAALTKHDLLDGLEQVVARFNGSGQRLVPRWGVAGRRQYEWRAGVQSGDDSARGEHPQLRGSELDGERQAVQATADLEDGPKIVAVELEAGLARATAIQEQGDGRVRRGRERIGHV
jgi:hypothetical protein